MARIGEALPVFNRRPNVARWQLDNLSMVLHEHSGSQAVREVAQRSHKITRNLSRLVSSANPETVFGDTDQAFDLLLTARIGAFNEVATSISNLMNREAVRTVFVDGPVSTSVAQQFFRAPAALVLPDQSVTQVLVAALVLRPGGSSTHLQIEGRFSWAQERDEALAAVERLVRAYPEQWFPTRPLWNGPAEQHFPTEVPREAPVSS